jgi:hypothetical protein
MLPVVDTGASGDNGDERRGNAFDQRGDDLERSADDRTARSITLRGRTRIR